MARTAIQLMRRVCIRRKRIDTDSMRCDMHQRYPQKLGITRVQAVSCLLASNQNVGLPIFWAPLPSTGPAQITKHKSQSLDGKGTISVRDIAGAQALLLIGLTPGVELADHICRRTKQL
jgi:hypothetical protein